MIFIPIINILNISIILMTIIVFFNYSSATKPIPTLFQLVKRSDTDYFVYSERQLRPGEKKLSIYEFFLSKHNLEARRIPLPSDNSEEDLKNRIKKYCERYVNTRSETQNFDEYYPPEKATNNYCHSTFFKLMRTLFSCLSSADASSKQDEIEQEPLIGSADASSKQDEIEQEPLIVPSVLTNFLKNALNNENEDESNAAKSKCFMSNLKFLNKIFHDKDSKYAENVITKIGKIYEKYKGIGDKKETKFYMCMMDFKNGLTRLNKAIGKYTPERISKEASKTLTSQQKKIYNRKIIQLDDYNRLSSKEKEKYKMSLANKKKILEIDEIQFLQIVREPNNAMNFGNLQNTFTGNYEEKVGNHIEDDCIGGIDVMNQLDFKVKKLSYLIYPNKWENEIQKYIDRKHAIIKTLKLFETNNNHIYKSYEDENNKMNELSFKRLKLCRAIPSEAYETYVIRLNNNDCVPLHKNTWQSEIIDMKSINNTNITNLSEFSEMKVYS